MKNFLNSIGGIIVAVILLIIAVVLAMLQIDYWYFALVLDALFIITMWNTTKQFYRGNRRPKSTVVAAILFLALIPVSLICGWNILVFLFIVIPAITMNAVRIVKKRKKTIRK